MDLPIKQGSETYDHRGKNVGIYMLHDLAGSPHNIYDIGVTFVEAGYSVRIPRLAGHGTSPIDLHDVTIDDILHALRTDFKEYKAEMDYVILFGFAFGGGLAQQLAFEFEVDGLILVNSIFEAPEKLIVDALEEVELEHRFVPAGTLDIKNDRVKPDIYTEIPVPIILELPEFSEHLQEHAADVFCPLLVLQSIDDHVYSPKNADYIVHKFSSREKHLIMLQDSFHFATVDYDQERIAKQCIFFIKGLDPRRED
ncbi:alpha/beta hydrolase [Kurthia sibirica]|uniref:Serine aminopeptidase S33 domain-containing protein n=1 Tax=Kurthia sibirica TaxID=202750 RepID=A0A2U3AN98_9BACL|nr:alpha/beta fold hydrolase [Kurthia sibirica]PWI25986.1 hypothetical protein DEX24_05495 [Kurthia sibirica]GEK34981.1 hypothetical protein KSI01_25140 [Kurthia sibirica]